jgi:hypothetical protein
MKWVMMIIGVLLALTGGVWLLQGVGILPGSFMSGQSFWAAMGLLALIVGFVLIYKGALRGRRSLP